MEGEREREAAENIEQTGLIKGGLMDILCMHVQKGRRKVAEKWWNELTLILAHTCRENRTLLL